MTSHSAQLTRIKFCHVFMDSSMT